jgi:phospholipase C
MIKHVVVLMLENRSFDNLLGRLYPKADVFDGLSGNEFNLDLGRERIFVNNLPGTSAEVMTTPDPNPGEHWTDINEQLFGHPTPAPGAVPTMVGFVHSRSPQGAARPKRRLITQAIGR